MRKFFSILFLLAAALNLSAAPTFIRAIDYPTRTTATNGDFIILYTQVAGTNFYTTKIFISDLVAALGGIGGFTNLATMTNWTVTGTNSVTFMQGPSGGATDYVLTKAADGTAQWQPASAVGQPSDTALTNLSSLASPGFVAITSADTFMVRAMESGNSFLTIQFADGASGDPIFNVVGVQNGDFGLTNLATISTNGIVVGTGPDHFTNRTIAATSPLAVSNGSGIAGDPTVAISLSTGSGSVVLSNAPIVFNPTFIGGNAVSNLYGVATNLSAYSSASTISALQVVGNSSFGTNRHIVFTNQSIAVGGGNPNLLNGVTYPGRVIHVNSGNEGGVYQASLCVDNAVAGGYASVVFNDSTAAANSKTFEIHVNSGAGVLEFASVDDVGALKKRLMRFKPTGEMSFGDNAPITGLPVYIYGPHKPNVGVLSVEGTDFGFIGVNGPFSGGSGYIISHTNGIDWLLYAPGNTHDFVLGEGAAATPRIYVAATTGNVGIATNAPKATLHVHGDSYFNGSTTNNGSVNVTAGGAFRDISRGSLAWVSDGRLRIQNNAGTDFERMQFGGTTASFPAIKRKGAGFEIVGADGVGQSTNNLYVAGSVFVTNSLATYGDFYVNNTVSNTVGTIAVINKPSGRVRVVAGQQTYFVTNSIATANSVVIATVNSDDTTALHCKAIPTAGLLTLKLVAAATADTDVSWLITSP